MAASQIVWRYWSLHWERRFNREFEQIWQNDQFNANACRQARQTGLQTIVTLLESMRTATDHRSKKFTARFFHFLKTVHALEEQLKSRGEEFVVKIKTEDDQMEGENTTEKEQPKEELTIEGVLQKHAGSISAIGWLFW